MGQKLLDNKISIINKLKEDIINKCKEMGIIHKGEPVKIIETNMRKLSFTKNNNMYKLNVN